MPRAAPALAAVPLVLAYGLVEGLWTNRWHPPRELEEAGARLARVALLTVGEWDGEAQELDARPLDKAEIKGHLLRRYVHRRTGAALTVLLVCGPAGPVAVHTPDVCFRGAGFAPAAPAARHTVAAPAPVGAADFWAGTFERTGAIPELIRVLWSWNAAGRWTAAEHPRWTFARAPVLYKLYVIRPGADPDEPPTADPSAEFLRLFLPAVQESLFPAAGAPPPP